ncbi:MAG: SpoIIE family protein phosphatase [Planctomycetes bacterium]|nr:SpoIIE family protein phosphatase [Planctomycetota bacterium]
MVSPDSEENTNDAERLRERISALERTLDATRTQLRSHINRAKSLDIDFNLAAKIHFTLLPQPIRNDRIEIDVRYIPIEKVGGDYCQVRFCDKDTCYITMCDVVGHGVQGALLATRVSSEVRHWILKGQPPRNIVQLLNSFIYDNFAETGMFLTFIASRIDLERRQITWSGAGHPSPLLIRSDGTTVERLPSQNLLIGVQEECLADEPEHTLSLNPGDRLVFHTDGLTETTDSTGKQLGIDGLATVAMCVELFDMADQILDPVAKYGPTTDDRTLIVAEIK